ncbi:MAG: PhoU domain-containing protein [Thermoprotei archaeon]
MVEARKVQKLGQTSLVVTLPKKWVNNVKLKQGDLVFLTPEADGSLKLMPKKLAKSEAEEITYIVNADLCTEPRMLERVITACYLLGYDKIIVKTSKPKLELQHLQEIRNSVNRHSELSIFDQKPDMVVIQCFVDPTRFPLQSLMKRMFNLVNSMLNFVFHAFSSGDLSLLEEIGYIEKEIDRLYWLSLRQLFLAQSNREAAKAIGIEEPLQILGNRAIVKALEEIADSIEDASLIILKLKEKEKISDRIKGMTDFIQSIQKISEDTQKALFELDFKTANSIIERVSSLKLPNGFEISNISSVIESILFAKIYEILDRYNLIAEIVINRSLERPSEILKIEKVELQQTT